MKKNFKHLSTLMMSLNNFIIDLPSPSSLTYSWNWGSMMGLVFMIQVVTGIFLASHYISSIDLAFNSIIHIMRDVKSGWLMRFIHMNGASMFFVLMYLHISRGIMFSSFKLTHTWLSGLSIIFILMGTAFLGYVLPWGQMSFWGATVITNLLSAVPYLGQMMVEWLWGGFSINQATLSRFFSLHFFLPFMLMGILIFHLMSLHQTGSNSPTGMNSNLDKISFHPYFSYKDSISIILFIIILIFSSLIYPFSMGDPENFNMANPLNTPIHIQPEWYFLFAYAILRSIPNKLGGVVALVFSILVISVLTFTKTLLKSKKFTPLNKLMLWMLINNFVVLTWIGANPVEQPFESIGKTFSLTYFTLMMFMCFFIIVLKTMNKVYFKKL